MALVSMTTGAVDTGWTFYTPYSTTTNTSVIMMVAASSCSVSPRSSRPQLSW